jgi:hypothetical protein
MDMQAFIDAMSAMNRDTRSHYHLTLGALIAALEKAPADASVLLDGGGSPGKAMSYRGYYSDLSFEPQTSPRSAREVLLTAQEALGREFTGYKGGEFRMGPETPLWSASYSCCGPAIVGLRVEGDTIVLQTKEDEP